ncbi:MAG: pseudouridine synthase [Burkholderiaceae bacterium]|nr:pseudouridine synthase [Burkholderiaceae bacterium]
MTRPARKRSSGSQRRAANRPALPMLDGVSPSAVALPSGDWPTMLDFLAERFPRFTHDDWRERMRLGEVRDASGAPLTPDTRYQPNSRLFYYRRLPPELPIPFEETVLFQDDWLVVADKPHFLPVTPSGRYLQETLLVRLKRKLGIDTLTPMHRIDRDTAGLVLFTIQPATRHAYQTLFRQREVAKYYEAIAPMNNDLSMPLVYRSRLQESAAFMQMHEVAGEPNAETEIALLETRGRLARYALRPATGQKHQLRAQMAALGMPIVNDLIYPVLQPEPPKGETPDYAKPLQLLAKAVEFTDPVTGERRHYESSRCLKL